MTAPTTLPAALEQIEELRGQVRDLLRLLGQDATPSATGVDGSPAETSGAHEFSEGLVPKQAWKGADQSLLDLHQMIETVPDIIFKLDLQGNLMGWNRRLQTVTGFTSQELMGRSALSFVPESEQAKTAAAIRQAFEEGYTELEGHLLTKEQCRIPYHWTGAALKDRAGRIIGITGVGRDVSEQHRAKSLLDATMDSIEVGLLVIDRQGKVTKLNRQFLDLWQIPRDLADRGEDEALLAFVLDQLVEPETFLTKVRELYERPEQESADVLAFKDGRRFERYSRPQVFGGEIVGRVWSFLDVTERMRAEQSLAESRQLLDAIVESVPDAVFAKDISGNYLLCNQATSTFLGKNKAEVVGHDDRSLFPPDVAQTLRETDHRIMINGLIVTYEETVIMESGISRTFLTTKGPILGEQGQVTGIFGIARDMTEQKKTEAALRASEERLRLAMDIADLATWDWNMTTNEVQWSDNCERVKRLPPGSFGGTFEAYQQLLHPEDLPKLRSQIETAVAQGVPYRTEHRLVTPSGCVEWVEANGLVYRDGSGKPVRMLGTVRNITERKQAEEALREMNMALAHAMPGISRLAPDGRYEAVNENYADTMGYTPDELIGMDWRKTVHPDSVATAEAAYDEMMRTGRAEFEGIGRRKDGSMVWKHVLMVKILDQHGIYVGHHCFMRDITERKQPEEALRISEQSIRELYALASLSESTFDERIERLLKLGCRRFNCPIGLVTRVRGEQLEVAHVWAPGSSIQQGDLLHLQKTYCSVTLGADEPVRFEHAGASEWGTHPAYAVLGFECYLGTKLQGQEQPYGTICFLSSRPRGTPFSNAEIDFLLLMARWLSGELDRQSSLQALHESERRYRTLYDETPSMYFTVDEDGIVHSVNDYGAQYLGYRVGDLVGRSVLTVFPTDDHATVLSSLQDLFHHPDQLRQWECRKVKANGTGLWVREVAHILHNPAGPSLALIVCEDITEQKHAQEALRKSEERYARATAVGKVGVWELDVAAGLYHGDINLKALFGYGPDELSTDPYVWLGLVHPKDQSIALTAWEGIVSGSTDDYHYELRMIRKNGTIIWTEVRGQAERDEQGNVQRLIGATVDITDRKTADIALQISQGKLQQALNASNTGLWEWNTVTNEVTFSPEWKRQLGYEDEELPNTFASWESRLHPDDRARAVACAVQYCENPIGTFRQDFRLRHKDGTYRWIESQASFVTEADGRHERLLGSHTDITELKRVENTLAQRSHQQQIITEFGEFALGERGLQSVLDQAVQRIAQTLGTEYCKVLALQQDGTSLLLKAGVGWHNGLVGLATVSAGLESQAGYTLSLNEPVIVEDLGTESRFSGPPFLFDHGVISGLSVIIRREHQPWGVLGVHTSARRAFTQDDVNFVQSMANILGSLIERSAVEETLAHRERELRTMLDALPIGVWFTDQRGRVLYGNPVGQQIWSGAVKVGLSDHSHNIRHWENIEATNLPHRWAIGSALTKDQPALNEMIEIEAANGSRRTIRNSAVQVRNHTGALQGAIVLNEDITQRKQAEAALLESEERFRTLVGNIPGAVYRCAADSEWTMFYLSNAIEDIVGYPAAEFIGNHTRSYASVIHPDDRPRVEEATGACLRKHCPYVLDYRLVHANGSVRWVYEKGRGVFDPDGEVRFLDGAIFDITDRVEAEQAMRQQHELLTAIMDASIDRISVKDLDGRYIHMNRTSANALGMPIDEIIGWDDVALWGNESAASLRAGDRRVVESGETITVEESFTGEGKATVYLTTKAPYRDSEGRIIGIISVARDITERKQAEETLRQSETRFRSLFENSPIAYQSLDQKGRFIDVNQRLCWLLGYDREELIGREFGDLWADERQSDFPKTFASFMQTGKVRNELSLRHRDGTIVNAVMDGRIQRDKDGNFVRTHCILTDITERKKVEDALRLSEARLNEAQRLAYLGSWELDLMRNRLIWSDEIFRIFEIDQNQFGASYEAFLSLVHPDDREAVDQAYTQSLQMKTPYEMIHRLLLPDGRVKYVQERCETSYDATGAPLRSVGTVQDVTERMRLAEREAARLKQLQTLSELGLTLSGDPGEIFERVVRMIGDLFKVRAVCLSEIVGPELHFNAVYVNGQVIRDAGRCPLAITPCATVERDKELRLFDRVMEQFPQASFLQDHNAVSYCGFPALDAQGQAVAVTCLLDDKPRKFTEEEQALLHVFGQRIAVEMERARHLAERKQAEDARMASEQRLVRVTDSIPGAVYQYQLLSSREQRFLFMSRNVRDLIGITAEECLNDFNVLWGRILHEDVSGLWQSIERSARTGSSWEYEFRLRTTEGTIKWLRGQSIPEPVASDGSRIWNGILSDITERRNIEKELHNREQSLRVALGERERISEDLHDGILQSIYAIGLGLEACKPLIADQPKKSAAKLKAEIHRTIGQLNHVLEEVRNFIAGLDSHILDGQEFDVVLRTMGHALADSYSVPCLMTIEKAAARHLSTEQAYHVMNVAREALSNSFRHGRARKITLSLKCLKRSVRLSVTDDGVGFNPSTIGGAGHGLSNMASRAKKIGASFILSSKPRGGTKVTLDVPRRCPDAGD